MPCDWAHRQRGQTCVLARRRWLSASLVAALSLSANDKHKETHTDAHGNNLWRLRLPLVSPSKRTMGITLISVSLSEQQSRPGLVKGTSCSCKPEPKRMITDRSASRACIRRPAPPLLGAEAR